MLVRRSSREIVARAHVLAPRRITLIALNARFSSSSSDDKTPKGVQGVKKATANLIDALGDALPGKGPLAAALIAASPAYSGSVAKFYQQAAALVGMPTNQVLGHLRQAITHATFPANSPNSPLPLPPVASPPVSSTSNASPSSVASPDPSVAAQIAQVYEWIKSQPADKTCAQLAEELQRFSQTPTHPSAATSNASPSTKSTK
jgi:hypothetical protein